MRIPNPFQLAWHQEDNPRQDVIVWLSNDGKFSIIRNKRNLVGRFAQIKTTSKLPEDLVDAAEVSFNTAIRWVFLHDDSEGFRFNLAPILTALGHDGLLERI